MRTAAAVFFIIWWIVLFAMLPLGLRTQDDEDDVTLGTVSSAPRLGAHGNAILFLHPRDMLGTLVEREQRVTAMDGRS